jgi:phosphoribosyl 1,2-cyclic phosphodiesterase
MKFCAIASGSNGNSYYVGNETDSVVVDLGISCRDFVNRMQLVNLNPKKLSGIFVSHEHSDHIRGIEVFCKNFETPLYITEKTFEKSNLKINDRLINFIKSGEKLRLGNLNIEAFSKNHDAVEPCSFLLNSGKINTSVLTDIGKPCLNVINALNKSDVSFLESNYDDKMLENGRYPYFLKQRVSGNTGHLSNYQASMLALEHATKRLKKIFLSHLSGNNNTPEIAYNNFINVIKQRKDLNIDTSMTKRDSSTEIFELF